MTVTIIICDMCDAEAIPGASDELMRSLGWLIHDRINGMDLCPRCH